MYFVGDIVRTIDKTDERYHDLTCMVMEVRPKNEFRHKIELLLIQHNYYTDDDETRYSFNEDEVILESDLNRLNLFDNFIVPSRWR